MGSFGELTATATAAHAETDGAPYVQFSVSLGCRIHGLAVVKRMKRPTLRKMATTAPQSCATNWFRGFARRRYPVFKSPVNKGQIHRGI